jgi:hypothetical protein
MPRFLDACHFRGPRQPRFPSEGAGGAEGGGTLTFRDPSRRGQRPPLRMTKGAAVAFLSRRQGRRRCACRQDGRPREVARAVTMTGECTCCACPHNDNGRGCAGCEWRGRLIGNTFVIQCLPAPFVILMQAKRCGRISIPSQATIPGCVHFPGPRQPRVPSGEAGARRVVAL